MIQLRATDGQTFNIETFTLRLSRFNFPDKLSVYDDKSLFFDKISQINNQFELICFEIKTGVFFVLESKKYLGKEKEGNYEINYVSHYKNNYLPILPLSVIDTLTYSDVLPNLSYTEDKEGVKCSLCVRNVNKIYMPGSRIIFENILLLVEEVYLPDSGCIWYTLRLLDRKLTLADLLTKNLV